MSAGTEPATRRGVILAGGKGTRLAPLTRAVNKHLLPVFDKPMIFHPLSLLMLAGIRDIMIVTTPQDVPQFERLLESGQDLGLSISVATQESPRGLPDALVVAEEFLDGGPSCLVLGDNMVHGQGIAPLLRSICAADGPAHAFCCQVANPTDYGIAEVSETGSVISLEEKPERPKSKLAVIGLYFLDGRAPSIAKSLVPSARGETEIVDLLGDYLQRGELSMSVLGRGTSWMDMGTPQMLLNAANYVHALESRQRLKIGCIEEIAWRNGWIDDGELKALGERARGTAYGDYLVSLPTDR